LGVEWVTGAGGGEVFTWTGDHSAAGFNLDDLSNLNFDNAGQSIISLTSGIRHDVPTGDAHRFRVDSDDIAEININGFELFGHSLILDSDSDTSISSLTDDSMQFFTNSILRMTISNTAILPTFPINMSGLNKITGVLDPTNPQDVVTKAYGDTNYLGGANVNLSNLSSPTSINQNLIPDGFSENLGGDVNRGGTGDPWNNIYSDNTIFIRNIKNEEGDGNDINVFEDFDMQSGATIDFPAEESVPVGSATGSITIRINGVNKKIKVYNP